jgi:hypothetical protein
MSSDPRYWSSATPRKPTFCPAKRRPSKRTTVDVYRSEGARERRRLRAEYRRNPMFGSFKRWIEERSRAAA